MRLVSISALIAVLLRHSASAAGGDNYSIDETFVFNNNAGGVASSNNSNAFVESKVVITENDEGNGNNSVVEGNIMEMPSDTESVTPENVNEGYDMVIPPDAVNSNNNTVTENITPENGNEGHDTAIPSGAVSSNNNTVTESITPENVNEGVDMVFPPNEIVSNSTVTTNNETESSNNIRPIPIISNSTASSTVTVPPNTKSVPPTPFPRDILVNGTIAPTKYPTKSPVAAPSPEPTMLPSKSPIGQPSPEPSGAPSNSPTKVSTNIPSEFPSSLPSELPSQPPSAEASSVPSLSSQPTTMPSDAPTVHPSSFPSSIPTTHPTDSPSSNPSKPPSSSPSSSPTQSPTVSVKPTIDITGVPSVSPSSTPTGSPSAAPSSCANDYIIGQTISFVDATDEITKDHINAFEEVTRSFLLEYVPWDDFKNRKMTVRTFNVKLVDQQYIDQRPGITINTPEPTPEPTFVVTANPTKKPTTAPSPAPPTDAPTIHPTEESSRYPSYFPSTLESNADDENGNDDSKAFQTKSPTPRPTASIIVSSRQPTFSADGDSKPQATTAPSVVTTGAPTFKASGISTASENYQSAGGLHESNSSSTSPVMSVEINASKGVPSTFPSMFPSLTPSIFPSNFPSNLPTVLDTQDGKLQQYNNNNGNKFNNGNMKDKNEDTTSRRRLAESLLLVSLELQAEVVVCEQVPNAGEMKAMFLKGFNTNSTEFYERMQYILPFEFSLNIPAAIGGVQEEVEKPRTIVEFVRQQEWYMILIACVMLVLSLYLLARLLLKIIDKCKGSDDVKRILKDLEDKNDHPYAPTLRELDSVNRSRQMVPLSPTASSGINRTRSYRRSRSIAQHSAVAALPQSSQTFEQDNTAAVPRYTNSMPSRMYEDEEFDRHHGGGGGEGYHHQEGRSFADDPYFADSFSDDDDYDVASPHSNLEYRRQARAIARRQKKAELDRLRADDTDMCIIS